MEEGKEKRVNRQGRQEEKKSIFKITEIIRAFPAGGFVRFLDLAPELIADGWEVFAIDSKQLGARLAVPVFLKRTKTACFFPLRKAPGQEQDGQPVAFYF